MASIIPRSVGWVDWFLELRSWVKFIYSENVTKFYEISTNISQYFANFCALLRIYLSMESLWHLLTFLRRTTVRRKVEIPTWYNFWLKLHESAIFYFKCCKRQNSFIIGYYIVAKNCMKLLKFNIVISNWVGKGFFFSSYRRRVLSIAIGIQIQHMWVPFFI